MNVISRPWRRWDQQYASIRDSRGPERVDVGPEDPKFERRPVGFLADLDRDVEPLTWEGDNS